MSEPRQILTASQNKKASIGCLWMFGAALLLTIGVKLSQKLSGSGAQMAQVAAAAAPAPDNAAANRKAEEDALRAKAPALIANGLSRLALAREFMSTDRVEQSVDPARDAVMIVLDLEDLEPAPDGFASFKAESDAIWKTVEPYGDAISLLERVERTVADDRVVLMQDMDKQLVEDLERLRAVPEPVAKRFSAKIRQANKASEGKRRKIKKAVAAELKREGMKAALSIVCGDERPQQGGWDGEVVGAEAFIQQHAHDPDSVDVENCTTPVLTQECWKTTCNVRGKNTFGALVLNRMEFTITRNGVEGAKSLD